MDSAVGEGLGGPQGGSGARAAAKVRQTHGSEWRGSSGGVGEAAPAPAPAPEPATEAGRTATAPAGAALPCPPSTYMQAWCAQAARFQIRCVPGFDQNNQRSNTHPSHTSSPRAPRPRAPGAAAAQWPARLLGAVTAQAPACARCGAQAQRPMRHQGLSGPPASSAGQHMEIGVWQVGRRSGHCTLSEAAAQLAGWMQGIPAEAGGHR